MGPPGLPDLAFAARDSTSIRVSSRANPSRDGDAKPGIFPREDRPVAEVSMQRTRRSLTVKANLARFTWAVALLASMALTIGAGVRWDW